MSDNSISGKHLPWKRPHQLLSVCLKNVDIVLLYVSHAYHMWYEMSSAVKEEGVHVSFLNAPDWTLMSFLRMNTPYSLSSLMEKGLHVFYSAGVQVTL